MLSSRCLDKTSMVGSFLVTGRRCVCDQASCCRQFYVVSATPVSGGIAGSRKYGGRPGEKRVRKRRQTKLSAIRRLVANRCCRRLLARHAVTGRLLASVIGSKACPELRDRPSRTPVREVRNVGWSARLSFSPPGAPSRAVFFSTGVNHSVPRPPGRSLAEDRKPLCPPAFAATGPANMPASDFIGNALNVSPRSAFIALTAIPHRRNPTRARFPPDAALLRKAARQRSAADYWQLTPRKEGPRGASHSERQRSGTFVHYNKIPPGVNPTPHRRPTSSACLATATPCKAPTSHPAEFFYGLPRRGLVWSVLQTLSFIARRANSVAKRSTRTDTDEAIFLSVLPVRESPC
jgi:hypothetical protein